MAAVAPHTSFRTALLSVAGLIFTSLSGCEDQSFVENFKNELGATLQAEVNKIWYNASLKAQIENAAQKDLHKLMKEKMKGLKLFKVPVLGYWIYIYDIPWLTVKLGNKAPKFTVTDINYSDTATHMYFTFKWKFNWPTNGGTKVNFMLDLQPSFPDHQVKVYDIGAIANGSATVILPKSFSGSNQFVLGIGESAVDLKADAEGWFWTINVSNQVKSAINDKLVKDLIGFTFAKAFGNPL